MKSHWMIEGRDKSMFRFCVRCSIVDRKSLGKWRGSSSMKFIISVTKVREEKFRWKVSKISFDHSLERGVIWEETIILLPDNVHYVFLSATIPNAKQFAEWISFLHNQVRCSLRILFDLLLRLFSRVTSFIPMFDRCLSIITFIQPEPKVFT